jgi:hypothetical protein
MRERLRPVTAALLGLAASLSGCGTGVNLWMGVEEKNAGRIFNRWDTQPYGGLLNDFHGLDEAVHGAEGFWMSLLAFPFFFIDLPLSLAADTLTLPCTVPCALVRANRKKDPP